MRTWDYRGFAIEPDLASLEQIFDKKNAFFLEKWFFWLCDKSANSADIIKKKNVKESCVYPILIRIHNIGHIHKANFPQTQFSTSHPQKSHFLKNPKCTFFWKYLVCGFKIEISEYPKKLLIISYSPYKYEVHSSKTHEIRAKCFPAVFFFPSL